MQSSSVNLQQAFAMYLIDCKSRNLSPCSMRISAYAIKSYLQHVKEDETFPPTPATIREFIVHQVEKTSASTATRYYDSMHAFFEYCVRDELIEKNPMDRVLKPKKPAAIIEPLSTDEVSSMINALNPKTFTGMRDRLIISMLFDTGMRSSELCAVELDDLDFTDQSIIIRHGKGDKSRTVYFGTSTAKLLQQYLVRRGDLITKHLIVNSYGMAIERCRLRMIITAAGKRAGVKVTTHLLRHSFAVAMLRNGADVFTVQKMLGHSSLQMTRHYSKLADADVSAKHRLYSPSDRLQHIHVGRKKIK